MKETFDWLDLDKKINKNQLFYFKQTSDNEITSYFKVDNHAFARFEINKIKDVMNWK